MIYALFATALAGTPPVLPLEGATIEVFTALRAPGWRDLDASEKAAKFILDGLASAGFSLPEGTGAYTWWRPFVLSDVVPGQAGRSVRGRVRTHFGRIVGGNWVFVRLDLRRGRGLPCYSVDAWSAAMGVNGRAAQAKGGGRVWGLACLGDVSPVEAALADWVGGALLELREQWSAPPPAGR